jgi:multiple sugar transport system permease protein
VNWTTVLIYCLLVPLGITLIVPVWYMVDMAFTPENYQLRWPIVWIPNPFTFNNFTHIFQDKTLPVLRWVLNSAVVTTVGTGLTLLLSSLSAYAFARLEFPGRNLIFSILIASLLVPGTVTLIPAFLLLRDIGRIPGVGPYIGLGTYGAIWLPALAHAWAIFFLRQQFFAIPRELEDAAVVDGAKRFRVYWQICMPLAQAALVAQGIFTALGFWNDLFWPLIVLNDRNGLTLPVGLLVLSQGSYVQRGLAFAGAFLASAPPLIFYAVFQRQIIQGISTAGLAGR